MKFTRGEISAVDIVREIDRSYYHANDYLYPVTLFDGPRGAPLLAHCPRDYNVLDLEDLDGNCLTLRPKDDAEDVFHSRMQASVDGRWLLSNGWVWQPWRVVCVYDVARALEEPGYLSTTGEELGFGEAPAGTRLMALGDDHVVLFDGHPRVIQLSSGSIVEEWDDIDGGGGVHMPSVSMQAPAPPYLATDPAQGRFALGWHDRIVTVALVR